ncbi:MAG: hypothetical protein U9O18_00765, partial [Chloroflexota bacterium]|nr:hypothetical protein [Chloroflexota bacterium]
FTQGRLRTDMVARDWTPDALRAAAAERAAEAVARHVWSEGTGDAAADAKANGQPCGDPGRGWKPEPWA